MNRVAIIPARGGSKRIANKNIRDFLGKPIIAYSIEVAIESKLFDRVIVTTDSEDIANVAKEYGAEVPFMRPEELAGDKAKGRDVLIHALEYLQKDSKDEIDAFCHIYATAPFLTPEYLIQGLELLKKKNATMTFSVGSFNYPVQRALKINKMGQLEMITPEYEFYRSNDLEESYHDAGQFYWFDSKKILTEKKVFSKESYPVLLPSYLVVDIDTEEDWIRAELMKKAIM